jgi:hypothetical protein
MKSITDSREEALEQEWLWDIDKKLNIQEINTKKPNWDCEECMKQSLNKILCCGYHPETKEMTDEWACPNLDTKTWKCEIYETEDYPEICKSYHCKKR